MKIHLSKKGSKESEYLGGAVSICWPKFVLRLIFTSLTIGLSLWVGYLFGYTNQIACALVILFIWKVGWPEIITHEARGCE